ncbi:hypothetical protein [Actinoplanes sp. NPDC089786]
MTTGDAQHNGPFKPASREAQQKLTPQIDGSVVGSSSRGWPKT